MTIDQREFRDALGSFATGLTVVTTVDDRQTPVGMTVNSFASVSLDPPLVLWSVGRDSNCYDIFSAAGHFAIHVLHSGQEDLSRLFAGLNGDRFADLEWRPGTEGIPILPDCRACFQCAVEHRYEGGDHLILVGRVMELSVSDRAPLVFYAGNYRALS
jgi:flavin reductase (DIM6/NTAB) family NADH-FMN oxidoreductase RutF